MTSVEIFWPASLPTDAPFDTQTDLQDAGIEATCRLRPTGRGAELSVLVMITTSVIEPWLKAVFARLGDDGYTSLRATVSRLLHRESAETAPTPAAPASAVFESAATGAQFVFTPGLPEEAYHAALSLDPGNEPGRWAWDASLHSWQRFDQQPAHHTEEVH